MFPKMDQIAGADSYRVVVAADLLITKSNQNKHAYDGRMIQ
jgi:hypothetical protein